LITGNSDELIFKEVKKRLLITGNSDELIFKEVKKRLFQGGLPDLIQASYENNELNCNVNTFKRRV